jgi:hypothetical protein
MGFRVCDLRVYGISVVTYMPQKTVEHVFPSVETCSQFVMTLQVSPWFTGTSNQSCTLKKEICTQQNTRELNGKSVVKRKLPLENQQQF